MGIEDGQGVHVEVTGSVASLAAAMKEGAAAVEEGTAEITGAFEAMSATIEAALAPLIAFMAIFESFEFIKEAIDSTAEFGKQLEIATQKTGMSADALSALQYAADLSDVSVEQLTIGLQRLARSMEAAEKGTGPANDAFNAMGISVLDAENHMRPMHDVLLDLAAQFHTMEDGAGKTAIAIDIFGRSGASLIPLLNQGVSGIDELEAKARELGVTMGDAGVEKASKYTDALKEFHQVVGALERRIALDVLPTLTGFVEFLERVVQQLGNIKLALELMFLPAVGIANLLDRILGRKKDDDLDKMIGMAMIPTSLLDLLDKKTPAPDMTKPGKDTGPSQLEKWREELNNIKQAAIDNGEDLKQVELKFWREKLAIAKEGTKEYIEVHSKIIQLEEEIQKQNEATQKRLETEWTKTFDQLPKAFSAAINNMKSTAGSFTDFMREMWYEVVAMSAKAIWGMVAEWAAGEVVKTATAQTAAGQRVVVSNWEAVQIIAHKLWEGLRWIAIEAAKAAAAAWSAMAGIPVIGPALGVAAAVATFAGVMALASSLGGGSGGGGGPSGGGPSGGGGGGGGGGGQGQPMVVYAMDAQSFHDFAMKNSSTFAKAGYQGMRAGVLPPGTPGRGP